MQRNCVIFNKIFAICGVISTDLCPENVEAQEFCKIAGNDLADLPLKLAPLGTKFIAPLDPSKHIKHIHCTG